jgi:hypothetical protein
MAVLTLIVVAVAAWPRIRLSPRAAE